MAIGFKAKPIRQWLTNRTDLPLFGAIMARSWVAWAFAYGGLLFDLLVVPGLLWKRTRPWAFGFSVLFHLTNSFIFHIGIFPWLMIVATSLFLPPEWPRRWLGSALKHGAAFRISNPSRQQITLGFVLVYFAIQIFLPLRHWFYPGNVNWTEEGHRFSWRMKLRDKEGEAKFFVTDPTTHTTQVINPADMLTPGQASEMSTRPDMILQFAHHLASQARRSGVTSVEVRAMAKVSLNGRQPQLLIDPRVDLASQSRSLRPAQWITPLAEKLPFNPR